MLEQFGIHSKTTGAHAGWQPAEAWRIDGRSLACAHLGAAGQGQARHGGRPSVRNGSQEQDGFEKS